MKMPQQVHVRGTWSLHLAAGLCAWLLVLQPTTCVDFWTVTDIKNAMYADQKYFGGCYKLLNRTGTVGCEGPPGQISAMMVRLEDIQGPLTEPRAVLVSTLNSTQYLAGLLANPTLQANVKVVLVYSTAIPASDSAATAFPSGSEFSVYGPSSYAWNPYGTGLGTTMLPVPVFWLNDQLAADALWRAQANAANGFKGSSNWAQAELIMQATQPNATGCLNAGTCWPLGGFNVWAAMPPLPFNATSGLAIPSSLPTTLITASLDSNGIFHDFVQAADSPLSGLIAMIAAMRMLQQANQTATYTRQLVFAGLAGEVWNYLGSKRLTWDMSRGPTGFTAGLDLTKIDQVIEVGMIGRANFASAANQTRLYLHTQRTGGTWGDPSALLTALDNNAAISTDLKLNLSRASATNPGLPPSSIFSFLRSKPSIAAVLITEFDQQYINPYYQSAFDNGTQVSLNPIVSAAVLLARTLHSLAAPSTAQPLLVNMTDVINTVTNLALCLVLDEPGMSCPLATALLNPDFQVTDQYVSYAVKHYIGVLQYIHPNPQEPYFKKTLYRFLWNYMGLLASQGGTGAECAFQANQCPAGYSCIGWKGSNKKNAQLMGRCYRTTVSYHPSMTTALDYIPNDGGTIGLFFNNASEAWEKTTTPPWPSDPLWTESNWPSTTPYVRVLQEESPSTEWAVFGSGIAACLITGAVSWWGRHAFEKHLKAV